MIRARSSARRFVEMFLFARSRRLPRRAATSVFFPRAHPSLPPSLSPNSSAETESSAGAIDVVALGNMCVDVLLPPAPIPSPDALKTDASLASLDASAEAKDDARWEVGGNCNFLIAASRLGLRAECAGHVGDDAHGAFLVETLAAEGVPFRDLCAIASEDAQTETLKCFVLTDGAGGHAFCSRYDLGPWPLLSRVDVVDEGAASALARCSAVFVNGFVFDELSPAAVRSAISLAKLNAAGVFFDPGPRAFTFVSGDAGRKEALDTILAATDVILATLEEAAALAGIEAVAGAGHGATETGTAVGASFAESDPTSGGGDDALDPLSVARALFSRPGCAADWVVIKCGPDGAAAFTRRGDAVYVGAPEIDVVDTVGCGDSAAAAVVLGYLKIQKKKKKLFEASSGKIAYLPNAVLAGMMEETLTLATAVGSATATRPGAGRNVADAETTRALLTAAAAKIETMSEEERARSGISAGGAKRALDVLEESLRAKDRGQSAV